MLRLRGSSTASNDLSSEVHVLASGVHSVYRVNRNFCGIKFWLIWQIAVYRNTMHEFIIIIIIVFKLMNGLVILVYS